MDSVKKQKYMAPEYDPTPTPRLEGVQCAAGKSRDY